MTWLLVGAMLGLVAMRVALRRSFPLGEASVENTAIIGYLAFVASGFFAEPQSLAPFAVLLVGTSGVCLLLGHVAGATLANRWENAAAFGEIAWSNRSLRVALLALLVGMLLASIVDLLSRPESLVELFIKSWLSSAVAERSAGLIADTFGRARTGIDALVSAIRAQAAGFLLLAGGLAFRWKPAAGYALLGLQLAILLPQAGGARSPILIGVATIAIVWLRRRQGGFPWRRLLLAAFAMLVLLDLAFEGRSGAESLSLPERLQRTWVTDFAYGATGYDFGMATLPGDHDRALRYTTQILGSPIPRVLWPSKPIKDPNWELTEEFTGRDLASTGSITLLTPVAEQLFYFGPFLGLMIPFAYGALTSALQSIYRKSASYELLLCQVIVWAGLGMRHTFWNVALATVIETFVFLVALAVTAVAVRGVDRG